MDFLGLLDVLAEVLDLHDVVLGDKGVNLLSLLVDETSVFELGSQVQLQLNLEFVLEHSIDPLLQTKLKQLSNYLEHVLAHGVVQFVFQGLIFKVEFYFVTVVLSALVLKLNQVEVNLDGALWDGLGLVGLRELDLVLENVGILLHEEYLVDVDLGPLIDNAFYDVQTFLFSHLLLIILTT